MRPRYTVPEDVKTHVTTLMEAAAGGDRVATERLFPLVYDELRRVAVGMMARERGPGPHTLQPTALVHEAYFRLVGDGDVKWNSRAHFFGAAAQAMRRILIDHARHVKATRARGLPLETETQFPTLDSKTPPDDAADDLLSLDHALQSLKARDQRQHDVVMFRFFAGLTIEQTAEAIGMSPATVKNEWSYARAWLLREMERGRAAG